jgi:hypothetical protein
MYAVKVLHTHVHVYLIIKRFIHLSAHELKTRDTFEAKQVYERAMY